MRIFVMMIGIPGSGKTWLRQKAFYDAKVVCPDEKIGYTKDRPWTPQAAKIAWHESEGKFTSLLGDDMAELVVFDATNTTIGHRRKYLRQVRDIGFQTVAVYCETGKSVCLERNAARDKYRQVPELTIDRMCAKIELPTLKEGFHLVARIDPTNGVHSFHEIMDCECGDEIRERFKFLWGDAQHKTVTVVKE